MEQSKKLEMTAEMISERERGKGVNFCRTRRITGYLVQDLGTWNKAKLAELKDRTTHM